MKTTFTDFRGQEVQIGDKGILLVKIRTMRGISQAFLADAKYIEKTKQGNHVFELYNCSPGQIAVRRPEFIKA